MSGRDDGGRLPPKPPRQGDVTGVGGWGGSGVERARALTQITPVHTEGSVLLWVGVARKDKCRMESEEETG